MNVELINPFIESVHEFFGRMLHCEVNRGNVSVTRTGDHPEDTMVALTGLTGSTRGTVAISMPRSTTTSVLERLLGEAPDPADNDELADGVAEVVNIVAGNAKAKLSNTNGGVPLSLGLPTVVTGTNYTVRYPTESVWLDVPFTGVMGPFSLRVTFEHSAGGSHLRAVSAA